MKETWTAATFRVILVFLIILNVCRCLYNDSPHCDAMTLVAGPEGNQREKLKLQRTNGIVEENRKQKVKFLNITAGRIDVQRTSVREPFDDYGWINVCLKGEDLALSWKIMQPMQEGSDVKLCYEIKRLRDRNTIKKTCYLFHVPSTNNQIQLFCWFKTRHGNERVSIEAAASHRNKDSTRFFYGDFNSVNQENCMAACSSTAIHFRTSVIGCGSKGLIRHEEGVNIEQLVFNASFSTQCNNLVLNYSKKAERELEFYVNCAYNGKGRIYYLYTIRGHYCHKYITVRVLCDTATIISLPSSSAVQDTNQPPSVTTIILAVSVVAIFLLSVIYTTIFVIRNRKSRQRRFQVQGTTLQSRNESEQMALRGNIGDIEEDIT